MTTTLITARTVRSMQPTMNLIGSKMVMNRRARRQKSMRTMRSRYGFQWVSTARSMTSKIRSTRFRGFCAWHPRGSRLEPQQCKHPLAPANAHIHCLANGASPGWVGQYGSVQCRSLIHAATCQIDSSDRGSLACRVY